MGQYAAILQALSDLRTHIGIARAIQRHLVENAKAREELNKQLLTAMQKQEEATERLYEIVKRGKATF